MKKYLYLIIIVFLVSNTLFAQPWIENLKRQKPANSQTGTYNFYDIQQAFYQYWAGKDSTAKGKGWKPFKRWEWFWTPRVYPTGEFPNPNQTYTELKAFQKANEFNKKDKNKIQSLANWTSLGPTSSPGGYAGLGRINAVREDPNNSSVIYIGAASGGLWKSTNGGTSWTTTTDELGSIGVTDVIIDKNNSNIVYIATGDGDASDAYSVGVMKSTDGGNTWNTTGLNWTQSQLRTISRLLIDPTNSSILYAGGSFGIYKTTDAGASWSQVFSSMSVKDMEFKPGNSSVIYASGSYIYRSTNGGTNWTQLTNGLPSSAQRVALGVSPANSNYVYALMSNSSSGFMGLYRSTDGGDTWTTQATSPNLLGWESSGSDSGGQGWYDLCIAVDQSNINTIYTGGVNIWKSTNGGVNWAINAHWWGDGVPAVHADQHDLWFAPGTNRLYNGCDGGIYKTTNGGTNWNWLGSGLVITQFYRIGASQTNSNVWIAGAQDNGTKNYVNSTWQDVIGGDGMECIVDNSTTDYQYGELYYGRILRSSDGGNNFYDWVSPSSFSSEAGSWVTPYVQHPTNPQTLFIGYRNIYKTTDRGASWSKISSFSSTSTLNVLHVDPDNGTYIYASHGNDLMMSTDGGSNWSTKTLPSSLYLTYLAIKPTTPLVIYGSFSGYSSGNKVFYSTDGGSTWTNISYNLPNLPVNTIVYQKNTNRLYVGTDIGVFYLDPGQTSWVDFNSNLPNVVVNEIELQPAFSKMKIATYGRGIWESPIFSGEAVQLTAPSNSSTNVSITPTLTWNAVNLADKYELIIADNIQFNNPIVHKTNIASNSYIVQPAEVLQYSKTYYWKVRAIDDNAYGLWSNDGGTTYTFTTVPNPPGQVTLLTPANNSINIAIDGNVSWQAEANSNTYKLQIATDVNFTNIVYNQTGIATTSFTYSSLTNSTKYYWRVLGTNAGGDGPWSAAWNFTTISQYPELVLNLTNKVTCKGTNVDLGTLDGMGNVITATGGSGNFTYNWNPSSLLSNATTGNPTYINPNMMQTFYLTVLDNITGITKTGSLNVAISNGPIISMPLFKVIKIGNSINLDNQITSITGGVPPYTKVWKDNFGNILANVVVTPPLGLNNYFLTVSDVGNCSSTKRLSVIVTNYKENIDENNIALSEQGGIAIIAFPNPVEEMLNYYIITADDLSLKIDLVNLEGKVLTEKIHNAQQTQRESINVDKLSAGTYFLKVTNGSETAYFKFVKK